MSLYWILDITDSHSFPFYSQRVPQLTLYGAYTPEKIYFPEDIKDFVEYSRVRWVIKYYFIVKISIKLRVVTTLPVFMIGEFASSQNWMLHHISVEDGKVWREAMQYNQVISHINHN